MEIIKKRCEVCGCRYDFVILGENDLESDCLEGPMWAAGGECLNGCEEPEKAKK